MPNHPRKSVGEVMENSLLSHMENETAMKNAIKDVIENGVVIREAATKFGISKSALHRKILKYKTFGDEPQNFNFLRQHGFKPVFTTEEENLLTEYLLQASRMCYGLTLKGTQELAYRYAIANNKDIPQSWTAKNMAGIEWVHLFRKRHPSLSLRTPEATSLSRATSFNKFSVNLFFKNLQEVIEKHQLQGFQIYNCDETAVTNVHKPPKILAAKKQKQIGKVTSAERGTLVTMCTAICANGTFVPPFFIFPRKNFRPHMLNGAPMGSDGAAYPSGWMTSENFAQFIKHLIKNVRCSLESKILLILDNHESHIDINVLNLCKPNGIILLTLPPHCSHKLQPLDISCFGPFKSYYNKSTDEWMLNHPGVPMTIYDIASVVGKAFPLALTPSNIIKGFQRTGICPFNSEIFEDSEFLSSYVTDRTQEIEEPSAVPGPSTRKEVAVTVSTPSTTKPSANIVTPEEVRPHVKAQARKGNRKGRKKSKSTVLTDTPNKEELELAHEQKMQKIRLKEMKKQQNENKKQNKDGQQKMCKKNLKRKLFRESSSSESEVELEKICNDSTDGSITEDDETGNEILSEGDFVLVKFSTKQTIRYYVAKIKMVKNVDYYLTYLIKGFGWTFTYPEKKDDDVKGREDIVMKLPKPEISGGTERAANKFKFNIDLSDYCVY